MNSKSIRVGSIAVVGVMLTVLLVWFVVSSNSDSVALGAKNIYAEESYIIDSQLKVLDNNEVGGYTVHDIIMAKEEGKVYHYKNGTYVSTINAYPRNSEGMLTLPKTDETLDVTVENKQLGEITYESTLEQSAMFLNFLQSQGYVVTYEASTPLFKSIVVEKKEIRYRILIFNNTLMFGKLAEGVQLDGIDYYIGTYTETRGN